MMTQRAIRVLAVLSGLDPRIGGPPSSARDIWTAAVGAGIQVSGAVCVESPPLEGEIAATKAMERAGIAIVALPFTRHYGRLAKRWAISVPLVSWLLRSIKNFDVVQVHSGWVFSAIAGIVVAKAFRKPTVLIPHESLTRFDINNGPMAKRLAKRVIKFVLLRLSDKIVFSSCLERDDSIVGRFRSKAAVIYHPVADERTSTVSVGRDIPDSVLRVGFLGRLHPKKNVEALIGAITEMPNATLVVAGDGPDEYRSALMQSAVEKCGSRVVWLGFIGAGQRASFFSSIDVLVMPSHYECFGRAAAEAMTYGVPTVVGERTGVAELVRAYNCGISAAPEATEIRTALTALANDRTRLNALSAAALEASRKELSLEAYGRKIAGIYETLARARPTAADSH